jgi:diguanylate cyclase (GGDEF)-like protein
LSGVARPRVDAKISEMPREAPYGWLEALTGLAVEVQQRQDLDELLQTIVNRTAELLGVPRVSVRLFDPAYETLVAVCRAGEPLHVEEAEFEPGEGLLGWIAQHCQPIRTDEADADPRFVPRPGMQERLGAFLGVPLVSGRTGMGVLSAIGGDKRFEAHHESLMTLVAAICAPHIDVVRLARLSQVDPLTGSLNRRGFDDAFPEVEARPGFVDPLSVVMVDIDHFKEINDELGHAMGDEVLKHVAARLGEALRAGDAVVRYGGEEFLLILPGVDCQQAARVAERARELVQRYPAIVAGRRIDVTVSLGVAQRRPGESRSSVIERADQAMYTAKRSGRDRVEVDG